MHGQKIRFVLAWILLAAGLLIGYLIIWQQYLSADAKYAKDNYEYTISRIKEEYDINTKRSISVKYLPGDIVVGYLYGDLKKLSEIYLALSLDDSSTQIPESSYTPLDVFDPYDILSRLILQANDDDINTVYESLRFYAAVINTNKTEFAGTAVMGELLSEFDKYDSLATEAIIRLKNRNIAMLTAALTLILVGSVEIFKNKARR